MLPLTEKKEFTGIDISKFIMAIFVVAIHTHPFEGITDNLLVKIWNVIVRLAVPYFFIASGFFLFNRITDGSHRLKQIRAYGKRIIGLYISWTIIFIPITIWDFVKNNNTFYRNILLFIRGFFFIGENYYSWPLWYLLSMIYSLFLFYILIKNNRNENFIFIISIFLFFVSVGIDFIIDYNGNIEIIHVLGKLIKAVFGGSGRLFSGPLYIMIGYLFTNKKTTIKKSFLLLFSVIGIMFQIIKLLKCALLSTQFFRQFKVVKPLPCCPD